MLLKKTDYAYRIILSKNKNVNILNVYNSLFFSIFPLKGIRVYKNEQLVTDVPDNIVEEKVVLGDSKDKLIDVFGNERYPNSYSVLPLANDELTNNRSDNLDVNSHDNDGLYDSMSSYLTKYLPNIFSNNSDASLNNIYITIPIDNDKPVMLLENLIDNMSVDEIYNINENTRVTYILLEQIVKDIYIQFQYLVHNGFVLNNFSINNIILVQDRYVIFDSENIDIINENKTEQLKNMNKSFLRFVSDLLKLNYDTSNNFMDQLKQIENTEVFYFLKKIEREGVLLWM
tara:strand:- start:419 stop:1279 length:861 start_codon:yes stop_codon:yes gene_type:complete